jgi:hypothetical protein
MKLFRVGALFLIVGAAACKNDNAGTIVTLPPLAALRYMPIVPDTGALDFRIVDIVAYAPNQTAASFRTGGLQDGISTGGFLPIAAPVAAGTHIIRVFLNGTSPSVASTVLREDTVTLAAGVSYTYYLFGYANSPANGTPKLSSMLTVDTVSITAGNIAVRVLNLAPTLAGNVAGLGAVNLDGRVVLTNTAVPLPGAASFSNLALGNLSAYAPFAITTAGQTYRLALTGNGTASPVAFQATLPVGTAGTAATQSVPGTAVTGTGITAVIVPQSVTGTAATQTAAASVSTNIDSLTLSHDTVTVWRSITAATATACATPVATGAAAADIANVTGLTQPEYNGSQAVVSVTAGVTPTLWSQKTVTTTGATGAFTLTFGGATTSVLGVGATAAQVEAALGALSSVGATNVSVSGAGPYTILFMGTFTNTAPGALTASATGALTAAVTTPAVGCGTANLVTRDTVTFTGAVATDSFQVTVLGQTTPFMVVGAPAATVQAAIKALSTVGSTGTPAVPNDTVTGTGPYVVTFRGALNNQNVAFSAAMKAAATGTVAVAKAAFVFSGAATPSRFRYRIAGLPVSPATGAPAFKIVTSGTADFKSPTVLFLFDVLPPRTAP